MPSLFAAVKKRARKRKVKQAMPDEWWQDVSPNMGAQALHEFMQLVDTTQHIELVNGMEDRMSWFWCWETLHGKQKNSMHTQDLSVEMHSNERRECVYVPL